MQFHLRDIIMRAPFIFFVSKFIGVEFFKTFATYLRRRCACTYKSMLIAAKG